MLRVLLAIWAVVLIACSSLDTCVPFTLHANGDGESHGLLLSTSDFSSLDLIIINHCCQIMNLPTWRCAINSGARLFFHHGLRVHALDEVHAGSRLYCVPQGLYFVWPLVSHVGTRFYPENVASPDPNHPIVLTQLSHSPRVFSLSNFCTQTEIEMLIRGKFVFALPS